MDRRVEEPTKDEHGSDVHPAFGMISVHRTSVSPPGAVLFDSEIRHGTTMVVKLETAIRDRQLNRDWIHGRKQIVEVEMSEAQWASFVSSVNTTGVPCTLRWVAGDADPRRPGLPWAPRLEHSRAEAVGSAEEAFRKIREARDTYEAHKTVKNLRALHYAIENATSHVDYATRTLAEHTEDVVTKARADIEAIAALKVQQLELGAEDPLIALQAKVEDDASE